jgi:hypothetical protein
MILLWVAFLGPLVGVLANLTLNYGLVASVCNGPRLHQGVLHAIAATLLAIAIVEGTWAWRTARRAGGLPRGDAPSALARTQFLATLGAVASAVGALFVLAQWVPTFILSACMRAQ